MVSFFTYTLAPRLFKEYGTGSRMAVYEPCSWEKLGDQMISALSLIWSVAYYTSPIILTIFLRRGFLSLEPLPMVAKITTGMSAFVLISLFVRGFGRSQSQSYTKFLSVLEKYNSKPTKENREAIAAFDFEFSQWPVDFHHRTTSSCEKKRFGITINNGFLHFWKVIPCEIVAYLAIHTFGIRMIFPGCIKILQKFIEPALIQGRSKLIEQENGVRYKIKTCDANEIDVLFVDNRNKSENGNTLVICSEGNAGFYEIGIMSTPLSLKYSVLGWNHPGFAGSTGLPFPDQDKNAIDSIMQFANEYLLFNNDAIILFGWSIGGYVTLWAGSKFSNIKGIILDATFDDVLYLALHRMPGSFSGIVKSAIRGYVNLNNIEVAQKYNGPIMIVRRTEDEIICTQDRVIGTNRGNFLLLNILKHRFPKIFEPSQLSFAQNLLAKPIDNLQDDRINQICNSLMASYVSAHGRSYPILIGENLTDNQRNQLAQFLIRKHLIDFESTHCTPLPGDLFVLPWELPEHD